MQYTHPPKELIKGQVEQHYRLGCDAVQTDKSLPTILKAAPPFSGSKSKASEQADYLLSRFTI
jgi:hypothetical protein